MLPSERCGLENRGFQHPIVSRTQEGARKTSKELQNRGPQSLKIISISRTVIMTCIFNKQSMTKQESLTGQDILHKLNRQLCVTWKYRQKTKRCNVRHPLEPTVVKQPKYDLYQRKGETEKGEGKRQDTEKKKLACMIYCHEQDQKYDLFLNLMNLQNIYFFFSMIWFSPLYLNRREMSKTPHSYQNTRV